MKPDKFDLELMDQMGGLPPLSGEAERYTPWHDAMFCLLMGQALVTFHFEFFYLQYLLPLLGSVLIYLGARSLRSENKWFRLCWILGGARLAWNMVYLVMNATPVIQMLSGSWLNWPVSVFVNCITMTQLLALYGGTRLAFAVTGGPKPKDWLARGLVAWLLSMGVAVWVDLIPLTRPSIFGQAIDHDWIWLYYCRGVVFIALQIYFLRCLYRQSEVLAGRGFDITPAPVRCSGRTVGLASFGAVALMIPVALFFSSHIPNGPVEMISSPLSSSQTIVRDTLVRMGLPEEVANLLDESELDLCANAVDVRLMESGSYNVEEGRSQLQDDWLIDSLARGRSAMTAWAVVLPENQVRYYFIFRYLDMPRGHFQEQFSIDPIGNYPTRDYTARLIWDQGGSVRTVQPQVYLAGGQTEDEIDWNAVLFRESTRMELERLGGRLHYSPWFNFSIPRGAEDFRGYLAYTVDLASYYQGDIHLDPSDFYDSAHVFLRHQFSFLHYPFFSISDLGGAMSVTNYANVESAWQQFMLYGALPET